ncbi:ATP-binding protein [Spirillospora sp. CA-294931]|uniref:ATP-binding protein n=1 Tax=Spirillospora sp. CA-294931 TaxID=3240042 RepID=UPI003D8E420C
MNNFYGSSPVREPGPVPGLRRGVTTFIGRAVQRQDLLGWMDYRSNPYPFANVLNGPGSGKTALAVRVAQDLAPDYPGGQLFLELSQAGLPDLDASEALFRLLLQLGMTESRIPDSFAGRVEAFHGELRKPTLLVLDSVTSVNQVRELLPGRADCGVLMTSRRSFSELEGLREMDLGSMTEDEAFALLEARVGAERVASDPEAVRTIVRLCGGLPLALHMAGAQLTKPANRRMPLARFAERLTAERLDLLRTDHLDLRASFSLSHRELSPESARLFRLLSLLAVPDFGDDLAAAVDGTEHWEESLAELFNTHLIEPVGTDRARFHDLVKIFAQERAEADDTPADRDAALDRAMAWSVRTVTQWGRHVGVDGRLSADKAAYNDALNALATEHQVLMAIVRQAAETGRDDVPWRVVSHLAGYFEVGGHWADWLEGAELAVESASRLDDPAALAVARHTRSWPLRLYRRLTEAIEDAVAALRLLDDPVSTRADVLSHLGTLYRETHRYDESVRCLDEAAEIFRRLGDVHGEGLVLRTLGHVQFWRRDLDDAQATLTRAIDLLRQAGDQAAEAWSHNNLCSVLGALWRYDEAENHHHEALRLFHQIDHQQGQAWAHNHLGRILGQYNRPDEAAHHNETALGIFEEIGDTYGTAWALLHLGTARQDATLLEQARNAFTAMEVPDPDGEGTALLRLGRLHGDATLLDESLRFFDLIGSLQGRANALLAKANLYPENTQTLEEALTCFRRAADPYGEAMTLLALDHRADAETILNRLGLRLP